MAAVNVTAVAQALAENEPYSVIDLTFNYAQTTTQNGTVIYYSANLSDGTNTESVLFPLTVTTGTEIPTAESFAYVPTVIFEDTVSATDGKIFYTA